MIDMRDDAEIPDVLRVHCYLFARMLSEALVRRTARRKTRPRHTRARAAPLEPSSVPQFTALGQRSPTCAQVATREDAREPLEFFKWTASFARKTLSLSMPGELRSFRLLRYTDHVIQSRERFGRYDGIRFASEGS